ncbi:MAG: ribosome-associated translation inhibitor RaiA [Beijerinckiaceae bacterium]|jgi:ribosomal subunit interface protein|nr:ribosome-associated translation inhibitor RaiA [Beijerinckiaceae bacterium]
MTANHSEGPITIESSNQDISDALRTHGHTEIQKMAAKYFGHLVSASAHFTAEGILSRCSITVQMGGLPRMAAEASDKDMRIAFNAALDKVATQLRRTKRELREDKPERLEKGVLPDGSRMI